MRKIKQNLSLFFGLVMLIATSLQAQAASCPSEAVRPFAGTWNGSGILIPAAGAQQQTASQDVFQIIDCQRFEIIVRYLNPAGAVTRTIDLVASPDPSGQQDLFTITGTAAEGASVVPMSGNFRKIQDGTLLGTFSAALGGQPAYFNELMNATTSASGEPQIIRSLQIFAGGRGGPFMAGRVTTERR